MTQLLYTHSKEDLERIVRFVVNEIRKTELVNENSVIPEEDRISQQEAAKLLGISVASLIQWKKKKLVPFYQIGRSIFYSKSELLNVAQKNRELIKPARK